jgi:hypothetical protein
MSSDPHDNGRTSVYIHFQVFCSKTLDVELCQGVLITMTTRTFVYVHFQVFGNKTLDAGLCQEVLITITTVELLFISIFRCSATKL